MAGELKFYYDKVAGSDSATSFSFFDAVDTKYVNNLNQAGVIDSNKTFDIHTLRFYAPGINPVAATYALLLEGIITLHIAGETKLQLPAWMCPGGGGPVCEAVLSTALATFVLNGPGDPRQVLVLDPPVTIPPDTSFKVLFELLAAQTMATVLPFLWVVLGGREY